MLTFFEYLPLVVFGLVYIFKDLLTAALALIIVSIITIPILWIKRRRVPIVLIVTTLLWIVLVSMTVMLDNTNFIKMKPTIVSLFFAGILLISNTCKRYPLKYLFSASLQMDHKHWSVFSFRLSLYFVFVAMVNEYIWRTQSEVFWVSFKLFGFSLGILCFLLSQLPFLKKHGFKSPVKTVKTTKSL